MGVVAPFLFILFHMLILFDFLLACLGGAALTRKSLGLSVDNSEPLFAAVKLLTFLLAATGLCSKLQY